MSLAGGLVGAGIGGGLVAAAAPEGGFTGDLGGGGGGGGGGMGRKVGLAARYKSLGPGREGGVDMGSGGGVCMPSGGGSGGMGGVPGMLWGDQVAALAAGCCMHSFMDETPGAGCGEAMRGAACGVTGSRVTGMLPIIIMLGRGLWGWAVGTKGEGGWSRCWGIGGFWLLRAACGKSKKY